MADPISMLAIGSSIATAAGGGIAAFGKYQEGQAASNMYAYKSAVAQQNALYQRVAGDIAAQRSGMKTAFQVGTTRAEQGRSGLDVYGGTAPLVTQGERDVGVEEQGIIQSDYARRAYGEQEEAKLDVVAGRQARIAGGIGAAGTLLSTAGSVGDKWLYGKQVGLFGSRGGGALDASGNLAKIY
jgi:hypothetical protein